MRQRLVVSVAIALGSIAACTVASRNGDGGPVGDGGPHTDGGTHPIGDAGPTVLDQDIVTPSAPMNAPMLFGGPPSAASAPMLVYPLDHVVVPPNLSEMEFHYVPEGGTVFELAFTTRGGSIRIYFGCPEAVTGGCIFTPDAATWNALALALRGIGETSYVLRSVDAAGNVGESAQQHITFAEQDVTGGLYFWTTDPTTVINRFEFGVPGAVVERYLTLQVTGAHMCIGCHTLSRDGTRIAVGTDIPTTQLQVYDVASRARIFTLTSHGGIGLSGPQQPNFTSFAPDDSQIVGSTLMGLRFMSATDGSIVQDMVTGAAASMPDWSPDGQHIAYVSYPGRSMFGLFDETSVASGSIVRLDLSGGVWNVGPTLVQSMGDNNFHPGYSPDGDYVVYVHSASNTGSIGGDPGGGTSAVSDAELWFVGTAGGATPVRMDTQHGLSDAWPRFNPTTFVDHGHPLFWLVWASRRQYGLRLDQDTRAQLWMCAFDPTRAAAGQDASSVPFWVPRQSTMFANHLAQWTTGVARMTCTNDADCGGEFCIDGHCYQSMPVP
jgi:TolB protein